MTIIISDYNIRRQILDTGLSNYQIDLGQGPAPKFFIFALSDLDRLAGNETTSITRFTQDDLFTFDFIKDHDSVTGFPLTGIGKAAGPFYQNFLNQTNRLNLNFSFGKLTYYLRLHNPFSSGVVTFNNFRDGGFIIVANLDKMKIEDGALQVKLQFKTILEKKRVFLWMPVYERKLVIDKNLDVAVE